MKKAILIAFCILVMAFPAWAGRSIGNTGDALVTSGTGYLTSVVVHTDGTNSFTVAIYDSSTTATGSKIITDVICTTSATDRVRTINFSGIEGFYTKGLYFDITTSGTGTFDVYFTEK